jgi:hypothetical protein
MRRLIPITLRLVHYLEHHKEMAAKLLLLPLVLLTAFYTKEYTGQYQQLINNHLGGVFYVMFASLVISVLFRRWNSWGATLAAFAGTCVLEVIQYFRVPFIMELTQKKVFLYLLGHSFSPVDFYYYGIGAAASLLMLWLIRLDEAGA